MAQTKDIIIQDFNMGGLADSKFSGPPNSVYKLTGFDPHSSPGVLRVGQKMTRETNGVVPYEFCMARLTSSNGRTYWGSSISGKIWEKDTSGVWTLVHTIVPSDGDAIILELVEYQKFIYIITENRVHRIRATDAEGASEWTSNISLNWAEMNLDQITGGIGATAYTVTTGINEGATHKQTFVSGEPVLESVKIKILDKGTGNVTVAVHDASNNLIGSKQILNANLVVGSNSFKFAAPLDLIVGSTYHVHVYSSVADATLDTILNTDLEASLMSFYTTSDTEYHPSVEVNLVLYIADKNYLHQIDANTFSREAFDVAPPLRISSVGSIGTRVLSGTIVSDYITKTQIFDWDTFSDSFRASDPIDEVGINAFLPADNYVYVQCGLAGNIYIYDGEKLQLDKKIPGDYSPTAKAKINVNATANLEGQIIFGVSNVIGNPCDQGLYRIARNSRQYPYIYDFPYPISERNNSAFVLTNIEIGAVLVVGSNLYMSWRRNSTVTISIATPGVITLTKHGFADGEPVVFTTTGALPTGITAGTTYYAKSATADTFNIYDTAAHAIAGGSTGRVNTSGSQSGIHTCSNTGIDKLDYSNKLNGAYIETRAARPDRFMDTVFPHFFVAYHMLPPNTSIAIAYKKNYATDYVATSENKADSDRKIITASENVSATALQVRLTMATSGNTAPELEALDITPQ